MKNRYLAALLYPLLLCLAACNQSGNTDLETPLQLDTLIINGLIYDGSDTPPHTSSIGIKDDRISFVGDHNALKIVAQRTIDADGHIVVPGFIDPHTHSLAELQGPGTKANINYQTQGVTTVLVGNDGGGSYQIDSLATSLEDAGIGTNVAFLVGHGAVREAAMGRENRAPTLEELEQMKQLVDQAMREGALGLSAGLYYTPGNFAATDEVVELARVAASYNGLYESHIRDESSYNIGFLAALDEALEIGRLAGLPVHIAHIKALGVDVWGESEAAIESIQAARTEGLQVTADQYPWRASGTHMRNALVPRWALADSFEKYQQRLNDPELLPEIKLAVKDNIRRRGGPDSLLIVTCAEQEYIGKTLAYVAASLGVPPVDAALEVLRLGKTRVVSFNMNMDDISNFMSQPWVMTSSDGNDGHPRKYASFPKKFREFVVERKEMTVQAFIHRSSGLVAETFGIANRGYLKPGNYADIAILDPATFGPQADYFHWNKLSTGVEYLFVNGVPAIAAGAQTDSLAGRALRKNLP